MKQPRQRRAHQELGRTLLDLTPTPRRLAFRKAGRRAIASRVKVRLTNSHASDGAAGGLRALGKRTQPRQTKYALVQPPKAPRRKRRGTDPGHTEAREAAECAIAKAAMNGRRREDW